MNDLVIFPLKSDKSPKVKDWQNYKGEVNTPMQGIVVPRGVYVIDIDLYKGVTRKDINTILGCDLPWDESLLQTTLNGGEHHAFKINPLEKLKQGSDILKCKGFDTRSSLNGYIATGEGYSDETLFGVEDTLVDLDLPTLPECAIELLREGVDGNDDDCDLLAAISSEPLDLTNDELASYIDLVGDEYADNQDDWLKVGMALYHQTSGSELGWSLFDRFSAKCPEKYDEDANRKRWKSFDSSSRTNPVTFASVIGLAGGAIAKKKIVAEKVKRKLADAENLDDINEELKRLATVKLDNLTLDVTLKNIQTKYKELTGNTPSLPSIKKEIKSLREDANEGDYVDEYVFLTATGEYCQRNTKAVMGPRAFDVKHNRDTPTLDGEKQSACNYSNDKIDVVENTMYFPAAGELFNHAGLEYLNEYEPFVPRAKKGADDKDIVERIKGHIAHLLPSEREQWIVINYLAHNVQRPGVKLQWSPVLQGVQGDGKSLLAEMMSLVMGYRNVRIMNVQTLESAFTGWAAGQCMTFIEELKLDNFKKYEVLNNLKPYISNPVVEVTNKGKDPRTLVNTTNYFALTNFKDAIPIDENDRRYCILFSQWQRKSELSKWMDEHKDYYPKLYEDMRENPKPLYDWLMSHKIDGEFLNMKRAPDTSAKAQMQELSKSETVICLEDVLDKFKHSCMISDDEIDVSHLQTIVKTNQFEGEYEDFPKTKALKNALLSIGFEYVGRKRTKYSDDDNKHTVYKI